LGVVAVATASVWQFRDNFYPVLPGKVYRSAQLSGPALRERISELRLRSVLNLRGANPGEEWYDEECEEAAQEGVLHYDLPIDSEYPPGPEDLRELIGVLDRCERPVLIHCQSGIDRTGLAAAVCALLGEGGSPALAHEQLGLLYGYQLPWRTRTARQEAFLAQYEQWLAHEGYRHSPTHFRKWALAVYGGSPELAQNARPLPDRP
jgi:protein tyrosine/serine phosphatase